MTQQPIPSQQAPKEGRGCFFYGCIITISLAVLVAVGGYFGLRAFVRGLVNSYTQTTPMALPKVEIAADDLARLQARVKEFTAAVDQQKPGAALVLTEKEFN
ncbi:MAG: hypothetical protein FJ388_15630, partial [Verrucomicrobia bacterium]|nr:hypothetical protein [Verrucomicrobiota bacterium]